MIKAWTNCRYMHRILWSMDKGIIHNDQVQQIKYFTTMIDFDKGTDMYNKSFIIQLYMII